MTNTTIGQYCNNIRGQILFLLHQEIISLNYSGSDSFLYLNHGKIYKSKTQVSDIKPYPFCLGKISNNFAVNNMKKSVFFC